MGDSSLTERLSRSSPPRHSRRKFVRLEYDIQRVTDAIRQSEPTHEFADDLEHGGAPTKVQH